MGKKRIVGLVLAALVLLGLCCWWIVISDPWRLPPGDWSLYKKNFVSPQGRVIDDGNGGVTHSEGQGYGLLMAGAY